MKSTGFVYFSLFFVLRTKLILCLTSSHIPDLLVPCYNGSFAMENMPPLTIYVLVELLRKIELYDKTTINMRILTTSLLHEIIFDGVLKSDSKNIRYGDEILPFRARGHEFYKYKLVDNYFVSGESTLFENESLSQEEKCFLHNMLSISTDTTYRGDEDVTCSLIQPKRPVPTVELQPENMRQSNCPLMKGVVSTRWGSITPGHLVYGSSASLQNVQTSFANIIHAINKTKAIFDTKKANSYAKKANSLWISTIAADLAEAILNQANNNLILGTSGFWNDSVLPSNYYLSELLPDMTESKLLGGIDGLILGRNIEAWQKILMATRFSQVIDMYYSNRGIAYNSSIRASNRNAIFNDILRNVNLTEQIIGTTNLLKEIGIYDRLLSENEIEELATYTVEKFEDLADEVTKRYDVLDHVNEVTPTSTLEIILILDGSLDFYRSKQLIYSLAEAAQVSFYESKLGIINGQNGEWISNITGEIFDIFHNLEKSKSSWPTQLSLHLSFETIIAHYQNHTERKCTGGLRSPSGRAIVLLSNKARPTDVDIYKYKEAISSIKNIFPETNVIFALSDDIQPYFKDISKMFRNDSLINFPKDVLTLSNSIATILRGIPGQIVNIFCENSNEPMEDYLTTGMDKIYEIFEEYNIRYQFEIKFIGHGYGDIFICANCRSASPNETCKSITVNDEVTFNSKYLCPANSRYNLQFVLKVNNSNFRCAENDCRYPDQVRMGITWTKSGSGCFLAKSAYLILLLLLTHFSNLI